MLNNITVLIIQTRPSSDRSYLHHRGIGMTVSQISCNEEPFNFVGWFRHDLELTNDGGSAIGLAAEAAILKKTEFEVFSCEKESL